jgi:hypothetical protein
MTRRKTPRVDQTERNAAIVRLREQKVPYKGIASDLGITVGARQRSRTEMFWERPA